MPSTFTRKNSPTLVTVGLALAGGVCIATAGLTSGASIERALLGKATGALAWGPALFRGLLAFHGLALIVAAGVGVTRGSKPKERTPSSPLIPTTHTRRSTRRSWVILTVICTVALLLRLWRLNTCLWFDEVMTMVDFLLHPLREIVASFPSQNQHMLYSILGRVSVVVFGVSAAAARLPAVLFGVAGIAALYLLGRRTNGAREALFACALMAVSYHHVWFSQNARGYTGLLFFSILSTWLFLQALSHGPARWWIGYAASVSLGLWIHMTMIFVVGAHGLVFLAMGMLPARCCVGSSTPPLYKTYRGKAMLAWLFAATMTLQLYALSLPEFLRSALHETSLPSDWTDPWWVVKETVHRLADGGLAGIVVLAALVVVGAGFIHLTRRDLRVAMLILLPGLLGGATMILLGHNLWPRFFFFCMGFVLLMAVRGVRVLPARLFAALAKPNQRDRWAKRLAATMMTLVIVASIATLPRCYALPKQDYTAARDYVEKHRESEDGVVAVGLAGYAYHRYFAPQWSVAQTREQLDQVRREHAALWLLYTLSPALQSRHPDLWSAVQKDFVVDKVFPGTLGGGEIYVCRLRSLMNPQG